MESYEDHLGRMEKAADAYAAAIKGISEASLSRRPDEKNWSAKELICHLRDTEELYAARIQTILAMEKPKFLPLDPDRWAADRQYLRNDALEALSSFRKRRQENLEVLRQLKPAERTRIGVHAVRGPISIQDIVGLMAGHDDNHLDQLKRALAGKP